MTLFLYHLNREHRAVLVIYVGELISLRLFLFPIFLFAAKPKEFFLDGLKKLEQRSHKRVELRGEYVEQIQFFKPVACCFLYKAKDLSAPSYCQISYSNEHLMRRNLLSAFVHLQLTTKQ
jgi:hypothetical protein